MIQWKNYTGKKVIVRLKTNRILTGDVIEVEDSDKLMIIFEMIDKFNRRVLFSHNEILELKEVEV